jgi:hypothetical protein
MERLKKEHGGWLYDNDKITGKKKLIFQSITTDRQDKTQRMDNVFSNYCRYSPKLPALLSLVARIFLQRLRVSNCQGEKKGDVRCISL